MISIKVKFRPVVADGKKGTVYYQIIHERKVAQLATDYKILPSEWNAKRGTLACVGDDSRRRELQRIGERIQADVSRLHRIAQALRGRWMDFSVGDVVAEFRRCVRDYSLANYMNTIIRKLRQRGQVRTAETYGSALASFSAYLGGDIVMDAITADVVEGYEAYLKSRGNTPNTTSYYMRILRAVYNRAVSDGAVDDLRPFAHVYTGVAKTRKRALPLADIRKIRVVDLQPKSAAAWARDMFLMSFYLRGMSFVDMAFLRKTDLRNGQVTYSRRKTGRQLTIGWTKEMQAIVDRYPDNPTGYLLPIITSQGCNERTSYQTKCRMANRELKRVSALAGVDAPLSMYCARHSWASIAKAKGIPLSIISEGMGHDSEQTTQIYLASIETSRIDRVNKLIINALGGVNKRHWLVRCWRPLLGYVR